MKLSNLIDESIMFKIPCQCRSLFWNWCMENHIACEYMGTSTGDPTNPFSQKNLDTWYIGFEEHRVLAILKWS